MLTNHTFVLTTPSWNIHFLINNIKKNCRCQQVNEEFVGSEFVGSEFVGSVLHYWFALSASITD